MMFENLLTTVKGVAVKSVPQICFLLLLCVLFVLFANNILNSETFSCIAVCDIWCDMNVWASCALIF